MNGVCRVDDTDGPLRLDDARGDAGLHRGGAAAARATPRARRAAQLTAIVMAGRTGSLYVLTSSRRAW